MGRLQVCVILMMVFAKNVYSLRCLTCSPPCDGDKMSPMNCSGSCWNHTITNCGMHCMQSSIFCLKNLLLFGQKLWAALRTW